MIYNDQRSQRTMIYNDRRSQRAIWVIFILLLCISSGVFVQRVVKGTCFTEPDQSQISRIVRHYQMGQIQDRNGNVLVQGTGTGLQYDWADDDTKNSFELLLGMNTAESEYSGYTVVGKNSFLYGTDYNAFSLRDLIPNRKRVAGSAQLAIDSELQKYTARLLSERGYNDAGVVISDYSTGEILTAYSTQTYGGVFRTTYHPGSTMKMILACAALSIDPSLKDRRFVCDGAACGVECTHVHGDIDMNEAIVQSCNGYFVTLVKQLDKEKLMDELKKWGFDTEESFNFFSMNDNCYLSYLQTTTDENGIIETHRAVSEEQSDLLYGAIGQGNAKMTVAGLNFCTNAVLNNGIQKNPSLLLLKSSSGSEKMKECKSEEEVTLCSEETAQFVQQAMLGVTARGTGRSYAMENFASKTGTAELVDSNGQKTGRHTSWTTGGLVGTDSHYSITVCLNDVDGSVYGAEAGEIARDILQWMQNRS